MKKRISLPRNLFSKTICPPEKLGQMMCVNIYNDGKFNMNGRLATKLGNKALDLAFTEDGTHFILLETSDSLSAIKFPKSGSRKLPEVTELLKGRKIVFPAKYEVWLTDEGHWQGDLLANPTQPQSGKHRSLKKN